MPKELILVLRARSASPVVGSIGTRRLFYLNGTGYISTMVMNLDMVFSQRQNAHRGAILSLLTLRIGYIEPDIRRDHLVLNC